jgi:DNA-binding GntR family transcriptional regulator
MSLTFQPMMESRPIREIAYEVLKKAIITGEIPAGERIVAKRGVGYAIVRG